MLSFTDLPAAEVFLMGLNMLCACFAFAVTMLARRRLEARVVNPREVRLLVVMSLAGMLSASAAPPEKPIPKALPVSDEEPVRRTQDPFTGTTQTKGANSKRGKSSEDAAITPLGRYYRLVTGQVEKNWDSYLHLRRDDAKPGQLQLVFYVNKKGKVEGLRVVNDKESHPLLTEITLQAIKDAEIPPMPADVIPLLPVEDRERLKIQYDALIY
ncbi:hypothetical protein [Prosthecobacter sp.]|uniref:hypothetical protein n=1 Tax=Prosthecobacter sp. TaxID=1965333 RepID=UPI00248A5431|nr:hypothetical protein [Prosthecobacter sp.]MDI1313262.1 hypothetical protein [Prosthecobacter sp.]